MMTSIFSDTELAFSSLEKNSSALLKKYQKMEKESNLNDGGKFQENIAFLRNSWQKEQSFFNQYGVPLNHSPLTGVSILAQLTMAKGYIGM